MQQKAQKRLRFAPSPNGYLHFGHAYSALLNQKLAQIMGADFLIRMEDIDLPRCPLKYKEAMIEDLKLLNITTDFEIVEQSQRQEFYQKAIDDLMQLGVLYPCLATRKEIAKYYEDHDEKRDPDGALIYPELYKNITDDERKAIFDGSKPYALRLDMEKAVAILKSKNAAFSFWNANVEKIQFEEIEFDPNVWGDVVIARKDIGTSYHLSCVVDDDLQNITHVIRGQDLFSSTFVHVVLQNLLGLKKIKYYHHELLLDTDLKKLSKTYGSERFALSVQDDKEMSEISDLLNASFMDKLGAALNNIFDETSSF